ncbi:MAG TPA: hypothetical protein DCM49_06205 [Lachnospiraceae bacterium]|nr:hypothetical protein [Lachnospiraceae bacterium]
MENAKLTKRQEEILNFIKQEIFDQGVPPTVREICQAVDLKSTSSVHSHLETLEKKGYIKRAHDKSRTIIVTDDDFKNMRMQKTLDSASGPELPSSELVQVPVVGRVAAGEPILAAENIDSYFPVPTDRLPNTETFILKVKGESMINAGILDGDYVLVEQTPAALNGEIVVALIDDSATVKTFYKEKGFYRLQPENDYMDPIIVPADELMIMGRVIGVMRFFR